MIRDDANWLIFTIKSDKDSVQYFGGRAGGSHPLPLNVSEDVKEIYLITDRSNGKKHAVVEYDDGEREYSDAQMKKTLEGLLRLKELKMKITKSNLKQLIKEELQSLMEAPGRYRSSGYYGTTDGDTGDPRFIRQRDYSEPTGPSKPARPEV